VTCVFGLLKRPKNEEKLSTNTITSPLQLHDHNVISIFQNELGESQDDLILVDPLQTREKENNNIKANE
jgi:hypothetical protein